MNMKRLMAVLLMVLFVMPAAALALEDKTVSISTASEFAEYAAQTTQNPVIYRNLTINITDDIDMSDKSWTPFFLNGYNGAQTYTINGNNHTITGLTGSLFSGTWAGSGKLYINDLTIADSAMSGGKDSQGFGAFIGHTEATSEIVFDNCHLENSSVTGADWTGGFVGYAAGYSKQNDGPVFQTLTMKNCSVKGSTIKGAGSTGGFIGHATGNVWTQVNILNCTVEDNTITCTDDSKVKAGAVMGTVGVAGKPYEGKTGGVNVNAIVKGNTVKSDGVANNRIFGRFGSSNSVLTISGGEYYNCKREECVQPEGDGATGTELKIDSSVKFYEELNIVKVEDNKAEVSDGAVEEALDKVNSGDGAVSLPVADTGNVTAVELPISAIESVEEEDLALEIVMNKETDSKGAVKETTVALDNKLLETIANVGDDDVNVELKIEKIAAEKLNDKQIQAMEKAGKTAVVISASLIVGDTSIHDFKGGSVEIKIPFELPAGAKANDFKLIYVDDNGKTEVIGNARFENGYIYATLHHFSDFAVVDTAVADGAAAQDLPKTGDNSRLFLWAGLLMIGLCAFVARKRVGA